MRLALSVLLLAAMLGPAACGGDDSKSTGAGDRLAPATTGPTAGATGDGSSRSGATQGTTGKTGATGSTSSNRRSTARSRAKAERERLRSRHPTRRGDYKGAARAAYLEGRARCLSIPLRALARIYGAGSEQPDAVATAYAVRQAPNSSLREPALQGCLDGINSRLRRGQ
jgi:hypothetical protein